MSRLMVLSVLLGTLAQCGSPDEEMSRDYRLEELANTTLPFDNAGVIYPAFRGNKATMHIGEVTDGTAPYTMTIAEVALVDASGGPPEVATVTVNGTIDDIGAFFFTVKSITKTPKGGKPTSQKTVTTPTGTLTVGETKKIPFVKPPFPPGTPITIEIKDPDTGEVITIKIIITGSGGGGG